MSWQDAKEISIVVAVAALLIVPGVIWARAWFDCRKVGGILVKDGCEMPACVECKR